MIRIAVDSSSDYFLEELKEKNIELIPIPITLGESTYIEGIDLERNDLYRMIASGGHFPKTSQPSPQTYLDLFLDAKEKGDDMICLVLSSALSGSYQTAVLAKEMAEYDRIYLIDSLSATFCIKIMADHACRLRAEGVGAAEIAASVESLKSRVKVIAALDTLEYLYRGGRISKATASIGDMTNIKPIITLTEDGKIGIVGKCLGKNKAIHSILKHMKDLALDPDFPTYSIYSYGVDNCQKLEEKLTAGGLSLAKRLQIGPTIGSHIGPEAFGVIYVAK